MKRFSFRMSDEDRSYVTELAENGVHVMVNIDPSQGGIAMTHDHAELNWAWLEEIAATGISANEFDEEGDIATFRHTGDAVAAVLAAAGAGTAKVAPSAASGVAIEVKTDKDFRLLSSLEHGGFDIHLALDPHTGGLDAIHRSGACLKWSFITEIELDLKLDPADAAVTPPARDSMEVDMRTRFASLVMMAAPQ